MKTSYEVRAAKFARTLAKLFEYDDTLEDFISSISLYNKTHSRPIQYSHGVSRIAIMRADYVIKFAFTPSSTWDDGTGSNMAGDNWTEAQVYARAVADGFDYLLAKTTLIEIDGRVIAIMPRIDGVNDRNRCWSSYVTLREYKWLHNNICDLHEGNLGYRKGKPCIIDYAWDPMNEEEYESEEEEED